MLFLVYYNSNSEIFQTVPYYGFFSYRSGLPQIKMIEGFKNDCQTDLVPSRYLPEPSC